MSGAVHKVYQAWPENGRSTGASPTCPEDIVTMETFPQRLSPRRQSPSPCLYGDNLLASRQSRGDKDKLENGGKFAGFNPRQQWRRHEFFTGRVGVIGTQTHLPPKFSFSSNLGHFVLKMLENAKILYVKKKYTEMSKFLGGRNPRFSKVGVPTTATPPAPVGDVPARQCRWDGSSPLLF